MFATYFTSDWRFGGFVVTRWRELLSAGDVQWSHLQVYSASHNCLFWISWRSCDCLRYVAVFLVLWAALVFFLFKFSQFLRCSEQCVFCFQLCGKISDFAGFWPLFWKRSCDRHMSGVVVGSHFDISILFVLWLPWMNVGVVDCGVNFIWKFVPYTFPLIKTRLRGSL